MTVRPGVLRRRFGHLGQRIHHLVMFSLEVISILIIGMFRQSGIQLMLNWKHIFVEVIVAMEHVMSRMTKIVIPARLIVPVMKVNLPV